MTPLHSDVIMTSLYATGTGSVDKVGEGRGSFYSVNVPLNDGIRDQPFTELFARYLLVCYSVHHQYGTVVSGSSL